MTAILRPAISSFTISCSLRIGYRISAGDAVDFDPDDRLVVIVDPVGVFHAEELRSQHCPDPVPGQNRSDLLDFRQSSAVRGDCQRNWGCARSNVKTAVAVGAARVSARVATAGCAGLGVSAAGSCVGAHAVTARAASTVARTSSGQLLAEHFHFKYSRS